MGFNPRATVSQTAPGVGAGWGQAGRDVSLPIPGLSQPGEGPRVPPAGLGAVLMRLTFTFPGEEPTACVSDSQNPTGACG